MAEFQDSSLRPLPPPDLPSPSRLPPEDPRPPPPPPPPPPPAESREDPPPPPPPKFDASRMIGIIRRKALTKELAAAYHSECLTYCQELLELQKKLEEPYVQMKSADDSRKEMRRPPKRVKKSR